MSTTIADLDDWEAVHDLYDPGPYRRAFRLENLVLGGCCLSYRETCLGNRIGDCRFLFECWPVACYCGPALVKKYKIPKRKRGDNT